MRLVTERELNRNFLLKDGDYKSTKEIFERIAEYIPDKKIIGELDKDKKIIYHTAKDLLQDVEAIGDGLIDLGLEGKHIALSADNSYLYVMCDLAIAGGVGVVTPIDKDATNDLFITLLNKCEADALICAHHMIDKVKEVLPSCKKLKTIITIDKKVEDYPTMSEIMEKGRTLSEKGYYHNKELDLSAPAKLLFTSGTTGPNKGVILSQNNLSANTINCLDSITANNDEFNTSMSILPMHHATEINTHILARIAAGRLTYINDSMKNMMINIKIFKPHVITIVPMIANAFYKAIWSNATKAGKDKMLKKGIKLTKLLRKFGIDISRKLMKDVYEPFGGNLRQIVCGGAMLNPEVVKGFGDLGIFITNGFGITECGPLVSMNTDTLNEVYSVGKACPNLEVKLADINEDGVGELCVKGKSVTQGYYKDEEATKQVFDEEGFFHTGDLARIDKKGRIFLSGRKKNVIVLDNGKNVCPEEIELEVMNNIDYAKECVAYIGTYGESEKEGICLGLFIEDEEVRGNRDKIQEDFRALNKKLPSYKQINYINIVDNEYEKTSTKKIKRDTVLSRHDGNSGIKL
ncbi:MAG: hypothetical protein E7361_02925 [Clostridiales bacterium]|nr:hypothetical protein [Clostridiales bacterium]